MCKHLMNNKNTISPNGMLDVHDIQGFDVVCIFRWVPTFQRNILPPYSEWT
jgi:hypothetical protein